MGRRIVGWVGQAGLCGAALLAGCSSSTERGAGEQVGVQAQAVVTETAFSGQGPAGVARSGLALAATNSLLLADRVRVVDVSGGPAAVANVGTGSSRLGVETHVGDLWARGALDLRERASVTGVAEVAGAVQSQTGVVVSGGIKNNPALKAVTVLGFGATFDPPCNGAVNLEPGAQRTLAPDSYGAVTVKSRSTLRLTSGTYRFDSLSVESLANLSLDTAQGPVVVFVKSGLTFRGSVTGANAAANLLLALAGTTPAVVEAPFQGTIVAPSAKIKLASVGTTGHSGSFFAKDVEVAADTTVTLKPFKWESVLAVGNTRLTTRVSAAPAGSTIALPGATVELSVKTPASCGAAAYRVLSRQVSDSSGLASMSIPASAGPLRLCAAKAGFTSACSELDARQLPETVAELSLSAPHGAVHGSVLLADGGLCGAKRASFGTDVKASVALTRDGTTLTSIFANGSGRYVLPLPGPGSYGLLATCGESQVAGSVATSGGGMARDLRIGNRAPRILAFGATRPSGKPVLTAAPGETVRIKLSAFDPEGQALRFRYRDAARGLLAAAGSSFDYTVPSSGQILLWAEVTDSDGAYGYDVLRVGSASAGNRFIGALTGGDGAALANTTVRIKAFTGDTLIGSANIVTDSLGHFRSSLADAERFVVSLDVPGFAPTTRVYQQAASGIKLRTRAAKEHLVGSPNQAFTVVDAALGMELRVPANALVNAAGQSPTGPVRVLMDRDLDGSWILGDGLLQDELQLKPAATLSPAVISIVNAGDLSDIFKLRPGTIADLLMPSRDELQGELADAARLTDKGIWGRFGGALRDADGRFRLGLRDLGTIAVTRPSLGRACIRTRVDRASMVVPLDVTLKTPAGRVIRSFSIDDYGYRTIELDSPGYYRVEATPRSPSLVPGHDDFAISHLIYVNEVEAFPGFTVGPCETRNDLFRRDMPEHERYFSRGPENDEDFAKEYYDEVSAYTVMPTLEQFKAHNGFDAGDAVEARFYNRNELGIGRALSCRKGPGLLACYLVKYGEPGGPVDETLDDLMNDTNAGDTVAMQWTKRHGTRFFIYAPAGPLKTSTHFDLEGEKFAPGVCRGCHGTGTFVPVDPSTHLYRTTSEKNAASEAIRKINKMIYDTPGSNNASIRDYIARLYPNGVSTSGAKAVEQMPPLYADAGREDFYTDGVKPYCQLCHLADGRPDWTTSPVSLFGKLEQYACDGDAMPHGFVSHRNLWVGSALRSTFGCENWEPPVSIDESPEQPDQGPMGPQQCTVCPCEFEACAPFGCYCPCTDC